MGRAPNEFSRDFDVTGLGDGETVVEIAADAGERAALARRFGVAVIESLAATIRLERDRDAVRFSAHFVADVVQSCVVTLEPITSRITKDFGVLFAPAAGTAGTVEVAAEGDDDLAEPLNGDTIDLGEVVAENLGLNLTPYPRRGGVVFSAEVPGGNDEDAAAVESPCAVLRNREPRR